MGRTEEGAFTRIDHKGNKYIQLPTPVPPVTKEELLKLYGLHVHECGHHLRGEIFQLAHEKQPSKELFGILNLLEDDQMERMVANRWRGDRATLSAMNARIFSEFITNLANDSRAADPIMMATLMLAEEARGDWCEQAPTVKDRLQREASPESLALLDELVSEGWIDKMRTPLDIHETYALAEELHARLYPPKPKQEQPKPDEQQQEGGQDSGDKPEGSEGDSPQAGDGDKEKGDTQEKDKGEGEAAQGERTDQKEQGNEGTAGQQEGDLISWDDVDFTQHADRLNAPSGIAGTGIDYGTQASDGKVNELTPLSRVRVMEPPLISPSRYKDYMMSNGKAATFGNKVRRYLQAKAKRAIDKEKYHGTLDRGSLVRLMLPPIDGGDYNRRVFYTRKEAVAKSTAVCVLIDGSRSMKGSKWYAVVRAAGLLGEVFGKVLRMPTMIATHSNPYAVYGGGEPCTIGILKHFNKQVTPKDLARKAAGFEKDNMAANNDEAAIRWCYKQLAQCKEERKILIVLSDGAPAGRYINKLKAGDKHHSMSDKREYDGNTLELVTKQIEKEGKVELYGVGVQNRDVTRYYTNSQVVQTYGGIDQIDEEMVEALFNIIKAGATHK
jgi:cobaltochelatase CobT